MKENSNITENSSSSDLSDPEWKPGNRTERRKENNIIKREKKRKKRLSKSSINIRLLNTRGWNYTKYLILNEEYMAKKSRL